MKIDSGFKLIAALLGILAGFYLPEIFNFLKALFGG